jgi:cytochrome c biogenesis protein CcmG, thiol:disulfide interchange protein DsbE
MSQRQSSGTSNRRAQRPSGRGSGGRPTDRGPTPSGGGPNPAIIVGAVIAVLVVLALVVAIAVGGGDDDAGTETGGSTPVTSGEGEGEGEPYVPAGSVTVEGQPLAQREDGDIEDDPALGEVLPTIEGTSIDGQPMTIGPDGGAQLIVVLAHWCPHCQAEVPRIVDWAADGGLPSDMEVVGIATANSSNRPNYPAVDWLDREGWEFPTMADDMAQRAAKAVGTSAYPFMAVTDAEGEVVARTSGELTSDQLSELVARAEG